MVIMGNNGHYYEKGYVIMSNNSCLLYTSDAADE